ncbi:MAG: hypothetical protein ABJL54_18550 [Halioglobus sp.]
MRLVQYCYIPVLIALNCAVGAAELDDKTGLIVAPGFEVVSVQCTVCHSAALISQNRADREGWVAIIRWMQETQGLWPLGEQEQVVLDYLSTHYGRSVSGRRRLLAPEFLPPSGS